MGLEPTNLLTASQALYQLSYAPVAKQSQVTGGISATAPWAEPSWKAPQYATALRGTLSGPELDLSFCSEGAS
jgi:hypothetical protein